MPSSGAGRDLCSRSHRACNRQLLGDMNRRELEKVMHETRGIIYMHITTRTIPTDYGTISAKYSSDKDK